MTQIQPLINSYLEARFKKTFDIDGNDLSRPALQKLEEVLPKTEYFTYKQLDSATRQIIDVISADPENISEEEVEQTLNNYAKLAENENLPDKYRVSMYDLLLSGHDKHLRNDRQYLELLNRQAQLMSRQETHLAQLVMQARIHSHNAPIETLYETYKILRKKHTDLTYFPRMEEILDYAQQQKKYSRQQKKLLNENTAQKNLSQLLKEAKNPELSDREKILHLQNAEEQLQKSGLSRNCKYDVRIYICSELKNIYEQAGDEEGVKFYAEKIARCKHLKFQNLSYAALRRHQNEKR